MVRPSGFEPPTFLRFCGRYLDGTGIVHRTRGPFHGNDLLLRGLEVRRGDDPFRQPFQHFGHLLAGDRLSYLVMVVKVERPPTAVRQMPVPGG